MPFRRLTFVLNAELLGASHQRVIGDDVVHRPIGDVVESDDAFALHRDGQHVLVAEDADIGLFGQRRLQRERAALHVGDVGLEPIFLENFLLLGDIESAAEK